MSSAMLATLAADLAALIEQLIERQVELRSVVQEKLEGMRRCDVDCMLRASRMEGDLAAAVAALDRRRYEIVSQMCGLLGFPKKTDLKTVTLRMLAVRLGPQFGERLVRSAERLRHEMLKLAEINKVIEMVCREMMAHFKVLFAAMVQSEHDAPTYSPEGEVGPAVGARVLEAVG
jgi:hypothetical protein